MDITTIQLTKKFKDWLQSLGRKGENYEQVIKRVMRELGTAKHIPGNWIGILRETNRVADQIQTKFNGGKNGTNETPKRTRVSR